MKARTDVYDVGVIVGRFQVPELHDAHVDLIESVLAEHDKVIIVLGLSPLMVTRQNPLDFESRKQMILERFPMVTVVYAKDVPSDEVWSRRLDELIEGLVTPTQTVVLYGSRGSFIDHYAGRCATQELLQESYVSGTEVRKEVAKSSTRASVDFRRGVVWAAYGQFPTVYSAVDVAIFDETEERLLLARKPHESQLRFIGGFADPRSMSDEEDARREVDEEAHVAITDPVYVGSFTIDDWRYRGEVDCVRTRLFKAKLFSGTPRPDDDIVELRWAAVRELWHAGRMIVPAHRPLVARLLQTLPGGGRG